MYSPIIKNLVAEFYCREGETRDNSALFLYARPEAAYLISVSFICRAFLMETYYPF